MFAGLTGQRHVGDSKLGMDHLLPAGLGPSQHMDQTSHLPSPFLPQAWPEADIHFVVEEWAVWQEFLPVCAAKQRSLLERAAHALRDLETALEPLKCASARRVGIKKRPGFMAFATALLRWPDTRQAAAFVNGFDVIGDFQHSGIFRAINGDLGTAAISQEDWLSEAPEVIRSILESGPPRNPELIYTLTTEEQAKDYCSEFYTSKELDQRFGAGQWRPLERFLVIDPSGKPRVIDNARKSLHNKATLMPETIHTTNIDFVPAVIRMTVVAALRRAGVQVTLASVTADVPVDALPWLAPRLGADDLPDAYRGHPVKDEQLRFSVVAIWTPNGWRWFGIWLGERCGQL